MCSWVIGMDDLRDQFATLDAVPVPDLWARVERQLAALDGEGSSGRPARIDPRWRATPMVRPSRSVGGIASRRLAWLVVAALLAIVLLGGALAVGSGLFRSSVVVPPSALVPPSPPAPRSLIVASPSVRLGPGSWTAAEPMVETRFGETATRLPDGEILVVGGRSDWGGHGTTRASAELYDPGTGRWVLTGSLHQAREGHTAVLLRTGLVLVAGGSSGSAPGAPRPILASAELYDPATGVWTDTDRMTTGRVGATATTLGDGRVLVTGGHTQRVEDPVATAEIYDPVTARWSVTGAMKVPRDGHTATLLSDGRVLVAGGGCCDQAARASAELYDPVAATWTRTGALAAARVYHTAILLGDGEVLVFGGDDRSDHPPVTTAELYDPRTASWLPTGSPRNPGNLFEALAIGSGPAARLLDGRVFAAASVSAADSASELYDSATGSWTDSGGLGGDRYTYVHTVTLLLDGRVVVTYDDATAVFDPKGTP